MSLFASTLIVSAEAYDTDLRIAVLLASLISVICGYPVLKIGSTRLPASVAADQ